MSVLSRYEKLVEESKNALPALLRPFQYQTQILLELGRHVLVSVPTGQGKTQMQLITSPLMGGALSFLFYLYSCFNQKMPWPW